MRPDLREAVGRELGSAVREAFSVAGGDINEAFDVRLSDGRRVFVKAHVRGVPGMFAAEARGLGWLAEARAIGVPQVLAVGSDEQGAGFLALEHLGNGRPRRDFDETLGRALALLHRFGAPCFGLDHANFIGPLPQPNEPTEDWPTFYSERRLLPLLRRAVDRGLVADRLRRDLEFVAGRLDAIVGPREPPARLHGDLWAGNLHVGTDGEPWLIDPAVYGGHREVDLAMMQLFGGFSSRVFA
ncbi:MAG: fructosamine kinase family protein, partial [Polyangiaceae bacterium]|nr:fructosamine kinase family protein [Polyangiaceae bacterium]